MCVASALTRKVKDYQWRTGEESLLVLFHDEDKKVSGIHVSCNQRVKIAIRESMRAIRVSTN